MEIPSITAYVYVYGLDPGLEILISAKEPFFEKNRDKMAHIINSLKFD